MQGESFLEKIYEDDANFIDDVEMMDVEDDDEPHPSEIPSVSCVTSVQKENLPSVQETNESLAEKPVSGEQSRLGPQKRKRKKKKKRGTGGMRNVNWFVISTCRFLKEPKSYLVWEAVKILGVQFVKDLVEEVKTIECNGGQLTADKKRRRTPGGILWNVLKARSPESYKEIMKAGKEFEKQLKKEGNNHRPSVTVVENTHRKSSDMSPLNYVGRSDPAALYSSRFNREKSFQDNLLEETENSASNNITGNPQLGRIPERDPDRSLCDSTDNSLLVQAWMNGIKADTSFQEATCKVEANNHESNQSGKKKLPVKERLRFPVGYDDLFDVKEPQAN